MTELHTTPRSAAPARAELEGLLDELAENPELTLELTTTIERRFTQRRAVVVMDMTGFSRTTRQQGIVTFLLMIHHMQRLAVPAVEGHGGTVVKAEADNLWCLFDTVDGAVAAAREAIRRLEAANLVLPRDRELHLAVGIGYGDVLNIGDHDVFGDEVNLAGKLGEDLAERGEILLSAAARQETDLDPIAVAKVEVNVSGLDLTYFRLVA